jgi:membrane protein YqaA with SNARE-associated domain
VRRHGSPVLLLSWVPVVGDPLCVAAGWLRLNAGLCFLFMGAGKFARYWIVAALVTGQ